MAKRVVKLKNRKRAASLRKKQSEFVANVSHELKTPLTIIKTHTETLLSGAVEDKELANALLRRIDSEADHMYNIVKDLLTLADLENSKDDLIYKRLKLKPLIDAVAARIRNGAVYYGLELYLQYNADPELVINADRTRLEEALLNICNNSLKYSYKGSRISICVDSDENQVYIRITDKGIGISEEDLPKVFDRFFRGDRAKAKAAGSTGLGLPIAKEYIEAHGGSIRIDSVQGEGTTVTVTLPIAVGPGEVDG